jgi:hypothetical protein
MRRYGVGDVWTEASLLKAEEALERARAASARRALVREAGPPRRLVRAWLASLRLALGRRPSRVDPPAGLPGDGGAAHDHGRTRPGGARGLPGRAVTRKVIDRATPRVDDAETEGRA